MMSMPRSRALSTEILGGAQQPGGLAASPARGCRVAADHRGVVWLPAMAGRLRWRTDEDAGLPPSSRATVSP